LHQALFPLLLLLLRWPEQTQPATQEPQARLELHSGQLDFAFCCRKSKSPETKERITLRANECALAGLLLNADRCFQDIGAIAAACHGDVRLGQCVTTRKKGARERRPEDSL